MSLVRWNPIRPDWAWSFGKVFDDFFAPVARLNGGKDRSFAPALEVTESEDAYSVRAELPGISKEDVKVSIEDGVLTISGEKREEERKETDAFHIAEHRYGSFKRSIRLPETVDFEKADAEHKDGILRIALPKKEEAKPVRRELPVK